MDIQVANKEVAIKGIKISRLSVISITITTAVKGGVQCPGKIGCHAKRNHYQNWCDRAKVCQINAKRSASCKSRHKNAAWDIAKKSNNNSQHFLERVGVGKG